jgi:ATP-binding protein involved in chromosome partitioning
MAVNMIQQFISVVDWGDLDYLLIDMPPGTGDVQLTLAQQAFLTGSVIVTTPQEASLAIARKGLKMFQQVKVPILGVVENMSGTIFKTGGGSRLAKEAGVPFLGVIPLDGAIVEAGDTGVPVVLSAPSSTSGQAFMVLAAAFEREVAKANGGGGGVESGPKQVEVSLAGELVLQWVGQAPLILNPRDLRLNCPCAACVNEHTGLRTLDPKRIPLEVRVKEAVPVGLYGLALHFSDGHNTGIYRFEALQKLGCTPAPSGG